MSYPYQATDPAAAAAAAAAYAPQYPPAAYAAPYAAPPPAYAAPYGAYPQADEIRTLFLTGFPQDVKERELNNLLRFLPGYQASQLHVAGVKSSQAQGFALFDSAASASNAMRSITNLLFDEGAVLRCEMARKNMYIKDDASTKRGRYDGGYAYGGATGYAGYGASTPPQPQGYTSVTNTKDNAPCNTLFIGNLGDGTSEDELRSIFGTQPGFRQIKLNRGARGITCFVEFSDVASAMTVHQSQQGAVLQSSDRGGIRIQYSKNPFGKKRDFGGNYIQDNSASPAAVPAAYESPAVQGEQTASSMAPQSEAVAAAEPQQQEQPAAMAAAPQEAAPVQQVQEGYGVEAQPAAQG